MQARIASCGTARLLERGMRGVTLIELLVVITIIGILMAIAYPGYQSQIQSSRRADGKAALLDTAQRLERCFTRFNSYTAAAGCTIANNLVAGIPSSEQWYIVTDTAPAANGFALVATPQGAQTGDARCVNLTLNSQGVRGATGSLGADCW